jgi:hypothetical protein
LIAPGTGLSQTPAQKIGNITFVRFWDGTRVDAADIALSLTLVLGADAIRFAVDVVGDLDVEILEVLLCPVDLGEVRRNDNRHDVPLEGDGTGTDNERPHAGDHAGEGQACPNPGPEAEGRLP